MSRFPPKGDSPPPSGGDGFLPIPDLFEPTTGEQTASKKRLRTFLSEENKKGIDLELGVELVSLQWQLTTSASALGEQGRNGRQAGRTEKTGMSEQTFANVNPVVLSC